MPTEYFLASALPEDWFLALSPRASLFRKAAGNQYGQYDRAKTQRGGVAEEKIFARSAK